MNINEGDRPAERAGEPKPKIQLFRDMTVPDIARIAEITGGEIISLEREYIRTYYEAEKGLPVIPVAITFGDRGSIDLREDSVNMGVFGPYFRTPNAIFFLKDSAVIIGEDVTFVRPPHTPDEDKKSLVSAVTISPTEVTYKQKKLDLEKEHGEEHSDEILEAALLARAAVR